MVADAFQPNVPIFPISYCFLSPLNHLNPPMFHPIHNGLTNMLLRARPVRLLFPFIPSTMNKGKPTSNLII